MFRLKRRTAAVSVTLALLAPACSQPVTHEECDQLLDKYTELLTRERNREVTEEELIRVRQAARDKAAGSREFTKCGSKLSRRQYACAMRAPTVDDIERCML